MDRFINWGAKFCNEVRLYVKFLQIVLFAYLWHLACTTVIICFKWNHTVADVDRVSIALIAETTTSVSVLVWMTKMSDGEEDSGVHSQLQDERVDSPVDNEGAYAFV